MWIPNRLVLRNYCAFEFVEYLFSQGNAVLIQGINNSDTGTDSNGSGKSALQDAPLMAISGSSSRGVRDLEIVKNGEKSAFISFEMVNSISNDTLLIERNIFIKGSSTLDIYLNNTLQKDKYATVADGDKLILSLLDVTIDDLRNYYIINSEKYTSFFTSSDTKKRELIGRFSNAEKVSSPAEVIKSDIEVLQKQIREKEDFSISKRTEKNLISQQKQEYISSFSDENIKEQVDEINVWISNEEGDIKEISTVIEEGKGTLASQVSLLEEQKHTTSCYERGLIRLSKIDFSKESSLIEKQIQKVKGEISTIENQKKAEKEGLQELEETKSNIDIVLAGMITCPACENEFTLEVDFDINEAREFLPELTEGISRSKDILSQKDSTIEIKNKEISRLRIELGRIEKKEERRSKLNRSYKREEASSVQEESHIEKEIKDASKSIMSLEEKIEGIRNDISTLKKRKEDISQAKQKKGELDLFDTKINSIDTLYKSNEEDILKLKEKLLAKEMWISNLNKFYAYLTNKSLSTIQGYSNLFLSKLGSNLQLQIEGFKVLANKSIKENINPVVLRDGVVEGNFKKFSGGEKGRLELSVILANQTQINLKSKSGGLDLLWIDEVLDKIDSTGMSNLVSALNTLGKTVLVTSHIQIKEVMDNNILTVIKENGVSRIKESNERIKN